MTTTSIGRQAENSACSFLKDKGYQVLDQNWRTRYCEIDIIAKKNQTIYFIEVKFRKTSDWGSGIDYITPKKVKQMKFAGELWVIANKWQGDYLISAIEVSGLNFKITNFLAEI